MSFKNKSEMVYQYGDVCFKIIADMSLQISKWDTQTRTFTEAVCPIRKDLKPKFNPQIDQWLKHLGGKKYYGKLVDWMASCVLLDKINCAIYFSGGKGSGKTMFAHGLARIWTTSDPSKLEIVLSDFNDTLIKCPLVLADEQLPKKFKWESITPQLRSMLSITTRTLTRKYKSTGELQGGIRLVLTANNPNLLDGNESGTPEDVDAVAERFLYVKIVDSKAADYLKELGQKVVSSWWTHEIAEHALWLAENHVIKNPGDRFVVEGDRTEMQDLLVVGMTWNAFVCEWLVKYLEDPQPMNNLPGYKDLVRIYQNELLVNPRVIVDKWAVYLGNVKKHEPTVKKIGNAIRNMSKSQKPKQLRAEGSSPRYYIIDERFLISWSLREGVGDPKTIIRKITGECPADEVQTNVFRLDQTENDDDIWNSIGSKEKDKKG
jgi:hypothetical protein